jgi:hypothetical protein
MKIVYTLPSLEAKVVFPTRNKGTSAMENI